jgi:catechol 2,3-dioxygenase-like lactoylglutathione lyase family enzyme
MQVGDASKEAAYYSALMNWEVRSDMGGAILLDIGDIGGIKLRNGYTPPAGARPGGSRAYAWDGFCWGITPWDAKKVEAELRARGLDPVADHDGKTFESFHVKDPDGFDLQISNTTRRPPTPDAAPVYLAPFPATHWRTVWLDHISFQASNYKESVAFYCALLGWKAGTDEGSQTECEIGDVGNIIIRAGGGGRGGTTTPAPRRATIDHIAFGITPWDADAVKAELDARQRNARADTGGKGDIHDAAYQSYHTTTPNGFDLQISNATKARRDVR